MDRLPPCIEALRVLAMQSHNPNSVLITERRIDEFVRGEVPGWPAPLKRLLQAIEVEEAAKRQGEDWTIAKEYIRSQMQRLA